MRSKTTGPISYGLFSLFINICTRIRYLAYALVVFLFYGCESITVSEPSAQRDSGPDQAVDVSHIPEPVPREELRTIAGNKTPYTVLGVTYHLLAKPEGYREEGFASWYGKKFHGRKTSNGEIYDMFGMTAAHKTLPIPSYVRVTRVDIDKKTGLRPSIIVRVNDRGPFHEGRIIDLTYTAAKKLGFEKQGTARVVVEYIDPKQFQASESATHHVNQAGTNEPSAPAPSNSAGYALPANTFLQLGAFSDSSAANALKAKVAAITSQEIRQKIRIVPPKRKQKKLFKVQVGPFLDNLELLLFRKKLIQANLPDPHIVYP